MRKLIFIHLLLSDNNIVLYILIFKLLEAEKIKKFFKRISISYESKLKLNWTTIRPIVTHVRETWVLKESVKHILILFERAALRKTFKLTKIMRFAK